MQEECYTFLHSENEYITCLLNETVLKQPPIFISYNHLLENVGVVIFVHVFYNF